MNVTKSQKLWLGLLGVGLAAFAADRLTAGGAPAAADAAPTELVAEMSPSAHAVAGPHGAASLAARLAELERPVEGAVRDAFASPVAWAAAKPGGTGSEDDAGTRFGQSHGLRAVLQDGGGGRALVGSTLVGVGQTVDGFTLLDVRGGRAVFSDGRVRVELTLDGTPATVSKAIGP